MDTGSREAGDEQMKEMKDIYNSVKPRALSSLESALKPKAWTLNLFVEFFFFTLFFRASSLKIVMSG